MVCRQPSKISNSVRKIWSKILEFFVKGLQVDAMRACGVGGALGVRGGFYCLIIYRLGLLPFVLAELEGLGKNGERLIGDKEDKCQSEEQPHASFNPDSHRNAINLIIPQRAFG